jgi:predicted nucleic acid-binding protein
VASFAEWHPLHTEAASALEPGTGIVTHAAFETYSALTRMQKPHRMSPAVVREWLDLEFADRWIGLSATALRMALGRLQTMGVSGGATYDGLIALTAAASGATLVTLDRRALPTYALVGVDVQFVS